MEYNVSEGYSISNQNYDEISTAVKIKHNPEKGDMGENPGNTIDWVKEECDEPLTNYCLTKEISVKKEFGNSDGVTYAVTVESETENVIDYVKYDGDVKQEKFEAKAES